MDGLSVEEELLRQYKGHIVPQSYSAGWIALSFVVSLVGAGSTLELINRRTGFQGLFNKYVSTSKIFPYHCSRD